MAVFARAAGCELRAREKMNGFMIDGGRLVAPIITGMALGGARASRVGMSLICCCCCLEPLKMRAAAASLPSNVGAGVPNLKTIREYLLVLLLHSSSGFLTLSDYLFARRGNNMSSWSLRCWLTNQQSSRPRRNESRSRREG